MANKTFCDGCNSDLTAKTARGEDGVSKFTAAIGEIGDGIRRSVALSIGTMTVMIDSCPSCMMRGLEVLSTIYKVPVSDLVEAIGRAKGGKSGDASTVIGQP